MFDIFGNGGVQPPHNLHKRAPAGNSSARRAPHFAHHAAAVGRTCGPPTRPGSEGVMSCSPAVRRLFESDERLRAGQQILGYAVWGTTFPVPAQGVLDEEEHVGVSRGVRSA